MTTIRKGFQIFPFLLFFGLAGPNAFSQFSADRFSFRIASVLHVGGGSDGAAALATSIEPRMRVGKRVSLGLRYDVAWLGFGEKWGRQSNDFYGLADADLSLLRSAGTMGHFHFKILQADFSLGLGLEYVRTAPTVERSYSKFDARLAEVKHFDGHSKISPAFGFNVDVGRSFFGLKFSTFKRGKSFAVVENYLSFSLGCRIINEQIKWEETPRAKRAPLIFFEFGVQYKLPYKISEQAGAYSPFVEPKIGITKFASLGFRYEFTRGERMGEDSMPVIIESDNVLGEEYILPEINRMAHTSAMLITVDKYFPAAGGWYFIGGGAGIYTQHVLQERVNIFSLTQPSRFPPIPERKARGFMLRAGIKTSLVRFGINLNYTGKGVSNYAGFQVGFEPSFLKK